MRLVSSLMHLHIAVEPSRDPFRETVGGIISPNAAENKRVPPADSEVPFARRLNARVFPGAAFFVAGTEPAQLLSGDQTNLSRDDVVGVRQDGKGVGAAASAAKGEVE